MLYKDHHLVLRLASFVVKTTLIYHKCIMSPSLNEPKHMCNYTIWSHHRLEKKRKQTSKQITRRNTSSHLQHVFMHIITGVRKLIVNSTEEIYRLKTNTSVNKHTWKSIQCTLLWPLNIIRWFLTGLAVGRAVPSIKPQHWSSGAPILCIGSANSAGSSHTKSRESRR